MFFIMKSDLEKRIKTEKVINKPKTFNDCLMNE